MAHSGLCIYPLNLVEERADLKVNAMQVVVGLCYVHIVYCPLGSVPYRQCMVALHSFTFVWKAWHRELELQIDIDSDLQLSFIRQSWKERSQWLIYNYVCMYYS